MLDLVVCGPVNKLGYGIVCANLVYELSKRLRVGLMPIGGEVSAEDAHPFEPYVQHAVWEAYQAWRDTRDRIRYPHLHLWHEWELGGDWSGPTIGMPFFETEPILEQAKGPLKRCDLVVVPSAWAAGVIERSVPTANVAYCKYVGYDPNVFHPKSVEKSRTLLHVGKFERRKGVDLAIKAFGLLHEEFPDLKLYCLIENPFMTKWYGEWLQLVDDTGIPQDENQCIFCMRPRSTNKEMAMLYRKSIGAIQPTHAEGWGLVVQEMLACGVPVATTNNTAHAEFVDEMGAMIIPSGPLEDANDGYFFNGDRKWPSIQLEDVVTTLRQLITSPIIPRGSPHLTWSAGADRLVALLKEQRMI